MIEITPKVDSKTWGHFPYYIEWTKKRRRDTLGSWFNVVLRHPNGVKTDNIYRSFKVEQPDYRFHEVLISAPNKVYGYDGSVYFNVHVGSVDDTDCSLQISKALKIFTNKEQRQGMVETKTLEDLKCELEPLLRVVFLEVNKLPVKQESVYAIINTLYEILKTKLPADVILTID